MKVSELIERLELMPQDARVCVSLQQHEYADMCGIGADGAARDVYVDKFGDRIDVFIEGRAD